jgi:uncharacterized protein YcbX
VAQTAPIRVSALYSYPIKSCAGISHQELALDTRGFVHDRRWMIANREGDKPLLLTQRTFPRMALIHPHFGIDSLRLDAPGMPTLDVPLIEREGELIEADVWDDRVLMLDEGDVASDWASDFLHVSARLLRMSSAFDRMTGQGYTDWSTPTTLADDYPVQVVSQASLDDLNMRLIERGGEPLPIRRFRPNIVVTGSGSFAEDRWHELTIGDVPFEAIKPCIRCAMTTVDPDAGEVNDPQEPLATLATFRRGPKGVLFSHDLIHRGLGTIHLGDPLMVQSLRPA